MQLFRVLSTSWSQGFEHGYCSDVTDLVVCEKKEFCQSVWSMDCVVYRYTLVYIHAYMYIHKVKFFACLVKDLKWCVSIIVPRDWVGFSSSYLAEGEPAHVNRCFSGAQ